MGYGSGRRGVALVAAVASLLTLGGLSASPASAQSGAYPSLGISPPGANDFSCRPAPAHPEPIVLVHGTLLDMTSDWALISPTLAARGYCVFALDYGGRGTGPIEDSAAQLKSFVDRVLAATGAARVSIVGHSQGAMMPRWYVKHLGGDHTLSEIVGLAPSNHGTTQPLADVVGPLCFSCVQQKADSEFMADLNAGDETPGPIDYTQITTRYDEVVTPFSSAFLQGSDSTNVLVQDRCPLDASDHIALTYDPVAVQWMLNALGRPGPADPAFKPRCLLVL
jgi:triacylglycerol esterase/lipase EstA (alpha/beta hydrolase family)